MRNIGIICEGPTDFVVLKRVIDTILKEENDYVQLQPEPNVIGEYGGGWKGVWKWCSDNAAIKRQLMKGIHPQLDILVIQMDADVSRKERISHCWCEDNSCEHKMEHDPLQCDSNAEIRQNCPLCLPCPDHDSSVQGYIDHIHRLIGMLLRDLEDTCIAVICDSTEAWIVAAYDQEKEAEQIENPWESVIAKKKEYHGIRISGRKKRAGMYGQMAETVSENWEVVKKLCKSAAQFERELLTVAAEQDDVEEGTKTDL